MKSKLAVLVGALLLAGSAYAQTNQVLSVNAVGYVKVDLVASNKLHLLANNFEPLSAPIAISNTFASMPVGTSIILWNSGAQAYEAPITRGLFGWPVAGTNTLKRGASYFLRTSSSGTNVATYPVYLMGEVPDSQTAPTSSHTTAVGLSFVGNSYPVIASWTNSAVAKAMPVGASVLTWDVAAQAYQAPITKGLFGWPVAGNLLMIQPGQGIIVRTTNSVAFSDVKPYTWP